jgi:hypothetical protein
VRHEAQGDISGQQDDDERRHHPPQMLVVPNHARNLRLPRYGIVTRRNDPGTEQE